MWVTKVIQYISDVYWLSCKKFKCCTEIIAIVNIQFYGRIFYLNRSEGKHLMHQDEFKSFLLLLSLFECQLETCFSAKTARLPRLIDNLNNLVTKLFWLWVVICVRIGLWSQSWNLVSRLFCKIYKARDWHKHGRQLRITKSVTVTWDERIEALKWFWLVSLVDQLWVDIWLDATDESRESNWQLRTFDIACVSFFTLLFLLSYGKVGVSTVEKIIFQSRSAFKCFKAESIMCRARFSIFQWSIISICWVMWVFLRLFLLKYTFALIQRARLFYEEFAERKLVWQINVAIVSNLECSKNELVWFTLALLLTPSSID